jgi:AcrR family transcriptional regulator
MTPRPYRMARRRQNSDENRARIVAAARNALADPQRSGNFSVEEVARRAGVARMTVYYQFGSLRGLLQALCDSLAVAGGMDQLGDAFRLGDPAEGLDRFVSVFAGFWESDRAVLRSLNALAAFDPELAAVLDERGGWRRKGIRVLLERRSKQTGRPKPKEMDEAADLLFMLTSFATYDSLAGTRRSATQVVEVLQRLARKVLA